MFNIPRGHREVIYYFHMGVFFAKTVNGYKPLTIFAKKLCPRCRLGSKYASVNITFT